MLTGVTHTHTSRKRVKLQRWDKQPSEDTCGDLRVKKIICIQVKWPVWHSGKYANGKGCEKCAKYEMSNSPSVL